MRERTCVANFLVEGVIRLLKGWIVPITPHGHLILLPITAFQYV